MKKVSIKEVDGFRANAFIEERSRMRRSGFVGFLVGVKEKISDFIWWFRHRLPPHRYHMVKTGLKPGYNDPCDRLLAAILYGAYQFVKDEEDPQRGVWVNWEADGGTHEAWMAYKRAAEFWEKYGPSEEFMDNDGGQRDEAIELAQDVVKRIGYMWYL